MADSPLAAPDSGKIGFPSISAGMNKLPPSGKAGGRGSRDDDKDARLGLSDSKKEEVLQRARKRFDRAAQAEADNRKKALDDLKFYNGEQWDSSVMAQRNFDNRPIITINKLPTFVRQVTNDVRQNRPGINVSPVGDRSDPEVAKMFMGMVREIERKSQADIAYDTAFAQAARAGWGWLRIVTEYEKPNSLNQVLTIKRIRNQFTVYADPASQEPDASDMKWCFVTEFISKDEFKEDYPDADPMHWTQTGVGDSLKEWLTKEEVRVAEYYEIEDEKRTFVLLENGAEGWLDEMSDDVLERFEIIAERESDCPKIHWYKLTAIEVLDDREVLGKWIPLVRILGDEVDIEGKPTWSGIVRNAKDAQRMFNYWSALETEVVALAPKAPFIGAEGQFEGYEGMWKNANVRSYPYLEYKPVTIDGNLMPAPARQQPVAVPAGIEVARQNAAQDMMATTGIRFDSTTKDRMYDESGRALRELRRVGDIGSFHLVDNLAQGQRHIGEILINVIPLLYDRKRIVTILRENDDEERVTIDPHAAKPMQESPPDQTTGKVMKIFNPTYGEYGVTVTIGPSYATKRIEASESMMDFLRAVAPAFPQAVSATADLIAKSQDWPSSDEFASRLTKLVAETHPGIISPDMKDVSPQVQAVLSGLMRQVQKDAQERVAFMKALTERDTEFALKADNQQKTFDAKLLAIAQKADAAQESDIRMLADAVMQLREKLEQPAEVTLQ